MSEIMQGTKNKIECPYCKKTKECTYTFDPYAKRKGRKARKDWKKYS